MAYDPRYNGCSMMLLNKVYMCMDATWLFVTIDVHEYLCNHLQV
jgi:hypothetical protein